MTQAELRLDGRVAVVTGAGRNIGRAAACLFAARGARVVVADLGTDVHGKGADDEPGQAVVAEISAAGGEAVAITADVSTVEGGETIVGAALEHFGRVDIVVNNAGILTPSELPTATLEDLKLEHGVHAGGAFNVTRAAWPHLVERGYGRVIMLSSSSLYGQDVIVSYVSAKGATFGLMRAAAVAGEPHGIKVNAVAPHSPGRLRTALGDGDKVYENSGVDSTLVEGWGPDYVAQPMLVLAHESCPVNGELIFAGGGRVSRMFLAETVGRIDKDLRAESLLEAWDEVTDPEGYFVPASTADWNTKRMQLHAEAAAQTEEGAPA